MIKNKLKFEKSYKKKKKTHFTHALSREILHNLRV